MQLQEQVLPSGPFCLLENGTWAGPGPCSGARGTGLPPQPQKLLPVSPRALGTRLGIPCSLFYLVAAVAVQHGPMYQVPGAGNYPYSFSSAAIFPLCGQPQFGSAGGAHQEGQGRPSLMAAVVVGKRKV